jgi:hypothetical protein
MYNMSQSYAPMRNAPVRGPASRLESIAHSAVAFRSDSAVDYTPRGNVSYAARASVPKQKATSYAILPNLNPQSYSFSSPFANSSYQPSTESMVSQVYSHNQPAYQLFDTHQEYNFVADDFLVPGKGGKFIGAAEDIQNFVEETFSRITGESFPDDIKISVLPKEKFRKLAPNAGTVGLSINRRQHGLLSEIFILNDSLGRGMLTVGHEIGHVLTHTLNDSHSEEAKAYAFSLAWMEVIKEHNIAKLGDAIVLERPAHNGLHDVSFEFVQKLLRQGKTVWDVYKGLIQGHFAFAA